MLVAICYDVVDNNRRVKLARYLDGVADRVQDSVFEGRLDDRTLERVVARVGKVIDPAEDKVRFYRLCATCERQTRIIGEGDIDREEPTIVI